MASAAEPRQGLVSIKSRGVHWVPSRYNARAQTPDGVLVLYNSYSGAVSGFREPHSDQVCELLQQTGVHLESLEELPRYLVERGFLVQATANELQRFRLRFLQHHQRPDRLELILLTSEECNFRCQYCYESFPRGTMEPWVREAVIRLMETRAPRLNRLSVNYFGGEPLLGMEAVEEIAPAAQKIAGAHGIQYSSSMTTNGYLLTAEVFEKLVGWNLRQYQITLDGERECHDHSRPLKGGGGTFDRILENLRTIKSTAHDFKVTLRVNFTPVNLRSMRSFLEEIGDFKDDKRFSIRFFPVGKWGGPNDADLEVCGLGAERERQGLDVLAAELGYPAEGRMPYMMPTAKSAVCYAARPYNLIVGADGKLMKCTVVLDTKEYNIVGRLSNDGRAEIDIDKLVGWTAPYFEDDDTCKQCFFLPVCQGSSCPLPRLELGKRPCPPQKLRIGKTLTNIWQQKEGKGRLYSIQNRNFVARPPIEDSGSATM